MFSTFSVGFRKPMLVHFGFKDVRRRAKKDVGFFASEILKFSVKKDGFG